MSHIRNITPAERRLYRKTYEIINGESIVNLDEQLISIKTPVANNNFQVVEPYNISSDETSVVLFHITDNSSTPPGPEMEFILEDTIAMDEIKLENIINNQLGIIIFNDSPESFNSGTVNQFKTLVQEHGLSLINNLCGGSLNLNSSPLTEPQEGCGGVLMPE